MLETIKTEVVTRTEEIRESFSKFLILETYGNVANKGNNLDEIGGKNVDYQDKRLKII